MAILTQFIPSSMGQR